MKKIPLTQGYFALVDDEDFECVNQFKWHAVRKGRIVYAAREAEGKYIYMHRFILDAPPGADVDHKDGEGQNNQRLNIRICSHQENQHSFARKKVNATSRFRGVHWARKNTKWYAHITMNQKNMHLGGFEDEIDAARARDTKARELGWPEEGMNFPR